MADPRFRGSRLYLCKTPRVFSGRFLLACGGVVVVAVAGYSSSIREGTRASESGHAATWVPFQSIVAAILRAALRIDGDATTYVYAVQESADWLSAIWCTSMVRRR